MNFSFFLLDYLTCNLKWVFFGFYIRFMDLFCKFNVVFVILVCQSMLL